MRTAGLIGGMSWESTAEYYRLINQTINRKLGGYHSAQCLVYSVDFHDIESAQSAGDWERAAGLLQTAALSLEAAGAEFLVLCTNTMHRVVDQMTRTSRIPLLHIGQAVADRIAARELGTVGLLGTRYTMEEGFYSEMLADRSVDVIIPEASQREAVHNVIYDELVAGVLNDASRRRFVEIIAGLAARGAEGVVLGCTEIPLLVRPDDTSVELFDTTRIHAEEAVSWALASNS